MNIKHIDYAIEEYLPHLNEKDKNRLLFFRSLWGVMSDAQLSNSEVTYEEPNDENLQELWEKEQPIFSKNPPKISLATLDDTFAHLVTATKDSAFFDKSIIEGLKHIELSAVISTELLERAGAQPTHFLDSLEKQLDKENIQDPISSVATMLTSLALRTQLEKASERVMARCEKLGLKEPRPLKCPVCGSSPTLAAVSGGDITQSHGKTLYCLQCGAQWNFERIRCVCCGTRNQSHIHFVSIEGDDAHRLAICDECGGYMRTYYALDALAPYSFEVEDVIMAKLNVVADKLETKQN